MIADNLKEMDELKEEVENCKLKTPTPTNLKTKRKVALTDEQAKVRLRMSEGLKENSEAIDIADDQDEGADGFFDKDATNDAVERTASRSNNIEDLVEDSSENDD